MKDNGWSAEAKRLGHLTAADRAERPEQEKVTSDTSSAYLEVVEGVRAARIRYAEAFLRFKIGHATDGQAHQQALLATNDELTMLEARAFIAKEKIGCPSTR